MQGLQLGVVKENHDDTYQGMVKVTLLACEPEAAETFWAHVVAPYAGDGYGMHLLPEVGDSVLVGFIGGDLREPVVLGSLWGGSNARPQDSIEKENKNKVLRTKGGNCIALTDGDKACVQIKTANGHQITIADEADRIQVETQDGKNHLKIDEKKGAITVCADKEITIEAKKVAIRGEIALSGAKIAAASNAGLTLEGKSVELKGNTTKLSGQTMDIKATASAKLESSAVLTLKGSMVKIN